MLMKIIQMRAEEDDEEEKEEKEEKIPTIRNLSSRYFQK